MRGGSQEVEVDESELVTVYNISDDPIAIKEIKDEMEFGFDTPITDDQAFDILTSKHDKTWIEMIADVHYDGDIDMAWGLIDFEKRADFSWTLQRTTSPARLSARQWLAMGQSRLSERTTGATTPISRCKSINSDATTAKSG